VLWIGNIISISKWSTGILY